MEAPLREDRLRAPLWKIGYALHLGVPNRISAIFHYSLFTKRKSNSYSSFYIFHSSFKSRTAFVI